MVSHCLCSDVSLPYGSHQQLFFPLMPQLELDQGGSRGPSRKGASKGQERQRRQQQQQKKGGLRMESLQKTRSTWLHTSAVEKTYLPWHRRLALSAVIWTTGTGVWERLLMVSWGYHCSDDRVRGHSDPSWFTWAFPPHQKTSTRQMLELSACGRNLTQELI